MLDPGAWESFAVMTGGASAALTGLLFVAVSINREMIMRHPHLRGSAAQTLVLLFVLVLRAFLLIALVLLRTAPRRRADVRSALAQLVDRRETTLTIAAFVLAAAISQWCGGGGGLYWLVPAILLAFISGVLNAWLFLISDATASQGND